MSKQSREQGRTQRAAAVRAEQARKERNRRVGLIVGVVVLLCAIVAAGAWYSTGDSDTSPDSSVGAPVTAGSTSLQVGDRSAPVKVVIYEDFQCPYCRELESSTRDFLRENAAKGKVLVEYQPIHLLKDRAYSERALNAWAAVLQHGTPQEALELHDLLYDHQPYEESSDSVSESEIAGWVKEVGADDADVRQAMESKDDEFFSAVDQLMTSLRIPGTPTVFIDGKQLPAASVPQLVSQIEEAVDQG